MEEGPIYFMPPIRSFKDTGFVKHVFNDGSVISANVVRSDDERGFAIELEVKDDSGHTVCDFTMDRFAAMCLVDVLVKNLLNQEEVMMLEVESKSGIKVNLKGEEGKDE